MEGVVLGVEVEEEVEEVDLEVEEEEGVEDEVEEGSKGGVFSSRNLLILQLLCGVGMMGRRIRWT